MNRYPRFAERLVIAAGFIMFGVFVWNVGTWLWGLVG